MDGRTVICLDEGIMAIGAELEDGAVAILCHRRISPVWLPDIQDSARFAGHSGAAKERGQQTHSGEVLAGNPTAAGPLQIGGMTRPPADHSVCSGPAGGTGKTNRRR